MKNVLVTIGITIVLVTICTSMSFAETSVINSYSGGGFQIGIYANGSTIVGNVQVSLTFGDEAVIAMQLQRQEKNGAWIVIASDSFNTQKTIDAKTITATGSTGNYRLYVRGTFYDALGNNVGTNARYAYSLSN